MDISVVSLAASPSIHPSIHRSNTHRNPSNPSPFFPSILSPPPPMFLFLRAFAPFLLASLFHPFASCLSLDGWALLRFRYNLDEDPGCALSSWNAYDKDPCSWFGIKCEGENVVGINLTGLSLRGTLVPELGRLTNLRELHLRGNDLMGGIPFQLGELDKLEVLDLSYNKLSGHLPKTLGNLSSLSRLYLGNNQLEGMIPSEIWRLNKLNELVINANRLKGTIPGDRVVVLTDDFQIETIDETGICKLKCLQVVDFAGNYFTGDSPSCLHHLPRLNFSLNCLFNEVSTQQRPIEDCGRANVSGSRRHLLQNEGSAGPSSEGSGNGSFFQSGVSEPPVPSLPPVSSPSPAPSVSSSLLPPSPSQSENVAPAESDRPNRDSKIIMIVTLSSLAIFIPIAVIVVFLCYCRKGTSVRPWKSSISGELQKGFTKGVPAFSRTELEAACEDFSNIIGASPDIVLFKGTLPNGTEIAVTSIRRSPKSWSTSSELIFWRKVETLSQMKHENLVNLSGYCAEENPFARMLVFDYVPNGTVYEHLHNKESEHLDWEIRMHIIMGVAHALEYMHHGLISPVTHTKLTSKSVFLSEDYTAMVADFGVWKSSCVQKYPGETFENMELSDGLVPHRDSNIYDFGVFLLEMVTGKPLGDKDAGTVIEWVVDPMKRAGQMNRIVDPTLESYNVEELETVGAIASDCLGIESSLGSLTMENITSRLHHSLTSLNGPAVRRKASPLLWAELQILSD